MTILDANQKLLRESAARTGRMIKEDGTVVNEADLVEQIAMSGVELTGGQAGDNLYSGIIGTLATKVALPSGAGKGPDTYVVDLSKFGSANIYLVALYATGTVTHTADIQYSNDGQSANAHPATAESLWAATAGNLEAAITKKDRYAHITVEQVTGTAELVHYYVVGREIA